MKARMLVITAALSVSSIPIQSQAVEPSPCVADAALCAPVTEDAACRSVALYVNGESFSRSETVASEADNHEFQQVHQFEVGARPLPSQSPVDVSFHVGTIESRCLSYLSEENTFRKSCGEAELGEVILDVSTRLQPPPNNRIRITADLLSYGTCSSAEPGPLPGINDAVYSRVFVSVGSGSFPINNAPRPNEGIGLGDGMFLYFNENHNPTTGCSANAGNAMRLVMPSATVILGWTSTAACPA